MRCGRLDLKIKDKTIFRKSNRNVWLFMVLMG